MENGHDYVQSGTGVPTQNGFDLLSDMDAGDDVNQSPGKPLPKKVRLPPIFVVNKGTMELRDILSRIPQLKYHLKAVKGGVQVTVSDDESFKLVEKSLKRKNSEFFSYTKAAEQPIKIILSGLPLFEIQDLQAELADSGIHPLEVKVFSRKKVDRDENVLYLLQFTKGSVKLPELQKVKALFNIIVKWRYYMRKPTDAVQCHRCQRFGHGMRNCNLAPHCVKCGEKHLTSHCKLPTKASLPGDDANESRRLVKCANCSGNHTANFRGCPARKHYLQVLETRKQQQKAASQRSSTSQRNPLNSVPANGHNGSSFVNGSTFAQVVGDSGGNSGADLFTITEFLCLARELFCRLDACRNKQQQFLALSELMIKYVYNG